MPARATRPIGQTQRDGTGEVNLPGVYNDDIGPARPTGTAPFYQRQTILECFDSWSISNIAPAAITEVYRSPHGLSAVPHSAATRSRASARPTAPGR